MLYIFDKDGTLIGGASNRPANTPEEQILLPGVRNKILELIVDGNSVAIASNQGGVAWGFITKEQAEALVLDVAQKLGGVHAWRISPYDPKAAHKYPNGEYAREDESRKPNPGMLISITDELGFDPIEAIMVGDQDSDQQAAINAGCAFIWAKDFFNG